MGYVIVLTLRTISDLALQHSAKGKICSPFALESNACHYITSLSHLILFLARGAIGYVCKNVCLGVVTDFTANTAGSWHVHISAQTTYELCASDTSHNVLPGFKKTLFHVLTLISLVCHPREQRGSLLYAAVICPISLLFLTSISWWYLVKVIFTSKSSALSIVQV